MNLNWVGVVQGVGEHRQKLLCVKTCKKSFGREIRAERNCRTRMAIWKISWDRFSNTSGRRVYMEPDIFKKQNVRAAI